MPFTFQDAAEIVSRPAGGVYGKTVSRSTYRDGRQGLLISALRSAAYARQEPGRAAFHIGHRKLIQRQLAHLRQLTRRPTTHRAWTV